MSLHVTAIISYEKFIKSKLNLRPLNKRRIIGVFKDKNTGKIVKGDNFLAWNIDNNAEKSYKYSLDYWNYTVTGSESEREFVSAEWDVEKGDED